MSKIEDIKKMVDEAVPSLECDKELRYLLSIIEQAEKAFQEITYSENVTAMNAIAEEALQAIRK